MIPEIIGLSGKAKSGKDTIANLFVKKYGFIKFSFADPLKEICSEIFNIPLRDFYNQSKKDVPLEKPITLTTEIIDKLILKAQTICPRTTQMSASLKSISSIRELMQYVGTDLLRKQYNENIWLEALKKKTKNIEKIIIADCRLENERKMVKELGGTMIYIKRDNIDIECGNHESENSFGSEDDYDIIISNNEEFFFVEKDINIWYLYMRRGNVRLK